MQETLADAPFFDPPLDKFKNLYGQWAQASYGLIITGQVQIDIRCMFNSDFMSLFMDRAACHFALLGL